MNTIIYLCILSFIVSALLVIARWVKSRKRDKETNESIMFGKGDYITCEILEEVHACKIKRVVAHVCEIKRVVNGGYKVRSFLDGETYFVTKNDFV